MPVAQWSAVPGLRKAVPGVRVALRFRRRGDRASTGRQRHRHEGLDGLVATNYQRRNIVRDSARGISAPRRAIGRRLRCASAGDTTVDVVGHGLLGLLLCHVRNC